MWHLENSTAVLLAHWRRIDQNQIRIINFESWGEELCQNVNWIVQWWRVPNEMWDEFKSSLETISEDSFCSQVGVAVGAEVLDFLHGVETEGDEATPTGETHGADQERHGNCGGTCTKHTHLTMSTAESIWGFLTNLGSCLCSGEMGTEGTVEGHGVGRQPGHSHHWHRPCSAGHKGRHSPTPITVVIQFKSEKGFWSLTRDERREKLSNSRRRRGVNGTGRHIVGRGQRRVLFGVLLPLSLHLSSLKHRWADRASGPLPASQPFIASKHNSNNQNQQYIIQPKTFTWIHGYFPLITKKPVTSQLEMVEKRPSTNHDMNFFWTSFLL